MSRAWIRHGLLGTAVLLGAAGAVGSLGTGDLPGNGDSWGLAVLFIGFALLGWFIVGRRPELPIGWLYLAGGTVGAAAFLASWWSFESLLRDPGSLPGGPVAAWLAVWLSPLSWPLVLVAPLVLFPTGRVRTRRWFWFMTVTGATIGILVVVAAARIDTGGCTACGGAHRRPRPCRDRRRRFRHRTLGDRTVGRVRRHRDRVGRPCRRSPSSSAVKTGSPTQRPCSVPLSWSR